MENKNKKSLIILIVAIAISLIGLAYPIYAMIDLNEVTAEGIVKILCYLFIIYYLIFGYKKPHGNLMKLLFLLFSFTLVMQTIANAKVNDNAAYLTGVASIFVAYAGGRLNRIKNNQLISVIVFSLLILAYAIGLTTITEDTLVLKIASLDLAVEWIAIIVAYFVRFNSHKEAGEESKINAKEN